MMNANQLEEALATLGELVASRGQSFEAAAIGGGGLLLLGIVERPTKDLDLVGVMEGGALVTAMPLPPALREACADVALALSLSPDWLNAGPAQLLDLGLPTGFMERTTTRTFDGLTLRIASRFDQIHFKLYAAVDQGPDSKHFQDLQRLRPTRDELLAAARWVRTHDPSEGFASVLTQALAALGVSDAE